jgi:hypothetical protein
VVRWVEISWFRPFFLILGDTMGYNYQENVLLFFFPGVSENRVYPKNGIIYRRTSSWFDGFVWFHDVSRVTGNVLVLPPANQRLKKSRSMFFNKK